MANAVMDNLMVNFGVEILKIVRLRNRDNGCEFS
jgi:hypothetical protein